MRRLILPLIGLLALFASSCSSERVAATPEQVVRQNNLCPSPTTQAQEFRVLGTRQWSQGVVVLYSAICPSRDRKQAPPQILGYSVLVSKGRGWEQIGNDSAEFFTARPQLPPEELVWYGSSNYSNNKGETYALTYGKLLSPKVAAVEITFDNGKILRDEAANGVFVLISPGANHSCQMRVLSKDDKILRRINDVNFEQNNRC
ncbi:hypothetical protein [Coleofasciculus sp. FACHB-SPT36]|uniref:hypothetical protein n=1 Tax=Cyanophyceae TaxID=3028117 RepID=UPI00168B8396|nr:hypothetical protein [Coleofasciculus sp. FACHB-SPT36]MBD2541681.1 hypothetical protein [Coleofasciculus sp. FACHB-SPT36]